ncbi:ABC transporter permease [Chenggangzhangella methanolivorans]|uniref:ABC transporter permease n=1 Tax=Chenggangzhangella methanolivorans TaxID=1437009 RepID=UPI0021BD3EF9|nr:hypothetical protein [Chenggangzhangella methanolivorans]
MAASPPKTLAQEVAGAPIRPHAARERRFRLFMLRMGLLALLVGVWQIASLGAPAFVLPGPARVYAAWSSLVATPSFWNDFGITFWRVFMGFAIAAVVGVPLGLVLGASESSANSSSRC